MIAGPYFDTRQLVEPLAQRIRRLVQLVRRQQRAFHIVSALFVAVLRLRPECVGGIGHAGGNHRQHALVQVIEQRCGLGEEHRQVILDARWRQPGFQVLVQRAAPGIHVEAFAQAGQHALHAGIVHRHFAARQHLDRVHLVQRALRFRVEHADRIDVLIQQFDAQWRVRAHRKHVQQAAADREIARVHHLRHVAVAGAFQAALFRIQIQALANGEIEAAADDVAQRRQLLQQGLHRHDHHAAGQAGQAVQGGQPLADDFRVRAELVVGQGFPIGKRHHRQRRMLAEQGMQIGFDLMRALVIAGDHQQGAGMRFGCPRNRPRQRSRRGRGAPVGAELAGLGQRRGGEGRRRHQPAILSEPPQCPVHPA